MTEANEFIEALTGGYDATVGEGGNQLSTGQKQLIALARAIIADPQIFVMDEATSSVDTHTERAIQSAIDRILRNRISFVIAHRLSTIKSASRILVIEGGKIIEEGNHRALIRRGGTLRRPVSESIHARARRGGVGGIDQTRLAVEPKAHSTVENGNPLKETSFSAQKTAGMPAD